MTDKMQQEQQQARASPFSCSRAEKNAQKMRDPHPDQTMRSSLAPLLSIPCQLFAATEQTSGARSRRCCTLASINQDDRTRARGFTGRRGGGERVGRSPAPCPAQLVMPTRNSNPRRSVPGTTARSSISQTKVGPADGVGRICL